MKKLSFALVFLAACAQGPTVEPRADDDTGTIEQGVSAIGWWPLDLDNLWSLENKQDSRLIAVDATYDRIAHVTGLFPLAEDGNWLGWSSKTSGDLLLWDDAAAKWRTFVKFGKKTGATWTVQGGACSTYDAKVLQKNATVQTPAGEFKKGYRVQFTLRPSPTARCAAPGFNLITFIEGVGPVEVESPLATAPFLLETALVKGKKIPALTTVTVAELEANPAKYDGQTVTVIAEPTLRSPICTKMACGPTNPCCNKCGAGFLIGTEVQLASKDPLGCSGTECGMTSCEGPFAASGNGDQELTGVFTVDQWGGKVLTLAQ